MFNLKRIILTVAVFFTLFSFVFAQEGDLESITMRHWIESTKRDKSLVHIIAYKAVARDDISVCNESSASQKCKEIARGFITTRRIAEGN
ncbi:MAG: hypothetical protein ISS47_07800, partial [Candidatus Omnitrophica bacterium]|nr:hypothetical protein [Candidatus Omnitrophota bacterium]